MSTSVTSVSAALNNLVTQSLNAIELGGKTTWQQTGGAGGQVIYPQGQTSNNTYYYPTFAAFDKQVTGNTSTGYNVQSSTLTQTLASLYQTFVYGQSAAQQAANAQAAQNASTDIISYFVKSWAPTFLGTWDSANQTVNTTYTQAAAYETQSWYSQSLSAWEKYNQTGDLPVNANTLFGYIQNSLWWQTNTAYQNKNSDDTITKKYSSTSKSDLYNTLVQGGIEFSEMFNPQVTNNNTTPWNDTLYADYNEILTDINLASNSDVAAQYNNLIIQGALSYLQAYTGNTSADIQTLTANTAAYTPVYSGVNGTPNPSYPLYLPIASYTLDPATIAQYATGSAGDSFTFTVTQSQSEATTFSSSESAAESYSMDEYSNWGFMSQSDSENEAAGESTSFSDYDADSSTSKGIISFNGIGYQTWAPSSESASLWLLSEQIADGINAVTSTTPYALSPNFNGGYGWTSSSDAATYASAGFAYIESLAYSFNPITVVNGGTSSESASYWEESSYANESVSENTGFGLGDWFGGGESFNESAQASDSASSSTFDTTGNTFTVTSNPIAQPVTSSNYGGLPALQIGASIQNVASPNPNTSSEVSAKYTKGSSALIDTPWIVLDSGSNIRSSNDDNIIFGSVEKDVLRSSNGNDEVYGESGNDYIIGGKGNDFLSGGSGKNTVVLGRGKDYLELNNETISQRSSFDKVVDFSVSHDVLWFTHGVNPALVTVEGNRLLLDGHRFAMFEGLSSSQLQRALNNAEFL